MYYKVTLRRLRRGKERCYILCVCVCMCVCVCVYVCVCVCVCVCVFFVAVGIQHAMCMRHIVIYALPGSAVFFHIIS